jgi:hypothetical protein
VAYFILARFQEWNHCGNSLSDLTSIILIAHERGGNLTTTLDWCLFSEYCPPYGLATKCHFNIKDLAVTI